MYIHFRIKTKKTSLKIFNDVFNINTYYCVNNTDMQQCDCF